MRKFPSVKWTELKSLFLLLQVNPGITLGAPDQEYSSAMDKS
jgi:hypothetical protein